MRIPSVIHAGFFALCWALVSPNTLAQSGSWVLDGWPDERNGYFARRTEIYADGDRLKIVEWPGAVQQDDEALETYHLGRSIVKVFTWHGERVGLVFESDAPSPRQRSTRKAAWCCRHRTHPFPIKKANCPAGKDAITTFGRWLFNASTPPCLRLAECSKRRSNRRRMCH